MKIQSPAAVAQNALIYLNSEELLSRTRSLVSEERRITLALVECLEEVQRRMLYAELGYASLWEFATRGLGLSEGAAQRRIQAMRLVRDVPHAKASLESGKLSLSNAAKVQSFRQAEKKHGRKPDAANLVAQVETLSQRQCEAKLFELSPEALPRERERIVSAQEERELKIVVSPALYEKLQRLRGLLAHAMPEASYAQLLEFMANEALERIEKKKGIIPKEVVQKHAPHIDAGTTPVAALNATDVAATAASTADPAPTAAAKVRNGTAELPSGRRVYLPAPLRKEVWARSGGRCEFAHAGNRCTSRYRLEIDHEMPLALGGTNHQDNLRIVCRIHNVQQAQAKIPRLG